MLEWVKCEWGCLDSMIRIEMWIWMKYERMNEKCFEESVRRHVQFELSILINWFDLISCKMYNWMA